MKRSFTRNLFLSVGIVFLLLAVCLSAYQYQREKDYKLGIMQLRLQSYSNELVHALGKEMIYEPEAFYGYIENHYIEGVRVTVILPDGHVLLDSRKRDVNLMENHLDRKEVEDAMRNGYGYDIKRTSETLHQSFFYFATYFKDKGLIVRIAVPYDSELAGSLEADNTFLYFAVFITIILGFVLYRNTSRIGKHVRHLRRFAIKAERGEVLAPELQTRIPNDELGDISHTIMQLYMKLRDSEEDKVRMKRQLTQNAAHELKTPAASIQGFLETIISNPDMSEEQRKYFLERCYAQSVRMSRLLVDMSALTKLDEAPRLEAKTVVELESLISGVVADTMLELESHGIKVNVSVPAGAKLLCEPSLIYSVFRNLIDNAIAYATGATHIDITCQAMDVGYEFTVADNGLGVEAKHLPLLFERFYRVDKGRSRKLGGTGLGLAIVKNAVTLHGGTVSAEPTPGGGLTVRFTLRG